MSTPDRWRDRAACLNDEYPQRWWVDMAGQYTGCQSIAACEAWVGRGTACALTLKQNPRSEHVLRFRRSERF